MIDNELAFAPSTELRELIVNKQVSPVEITELYFERINKLNPQLNAYLTLNTDEAMRSAKSAEDAALRGEELGPLHGIPISVKDLEMTKGIRTTGGSLAFKDRIPDEDSIVVERIKRAGAIILGKTNTPEFGLLGETRNRLGDHCRNPWNTERTSGGSSGGAGAAIISGMCSLATGSDGGGSIRIPASFCGTYGIKPTQCRVPRYSGASAPPVANQFGQSGPMSRTVRDSALLLQVMAGFDGRDPTSLRIEVPDFMGAVEKDISGLKIAWSPDFGYAAVDPQVVEIAATAAKVFEELGCHVESSDLALDSPGEAFMKLFPTNTLAVFGELYKTNGDLLTDYVRGSFESAVNITGAEYAQALGEMDRIKGQFANVFEDYDLLLSPTMAVPAFPVGQAPPEIDGREVHPFHGFLPFTYPINMIGHPAASVPAGFSSDGMPIGLHIVGRWADEETVLAASSAFERARPWIQHRPSVS